jgi:biopolymer transport protein ExbD
MAHNMDNNDKLNFELNLVPCIDLLSVLISFLLLTAVWVNIGAMNVKQAMGDASQEENKPNPPSVWVTFDSTGDVTLALKDVKGVSSPKEVRISNIGARVDIESLAEMAVSLKQQNPELKTAMIMPSQNTKYQDMIGVMDQLRKAEISDLGVAPL